MKITRLFNDFFHNEKSSGLILICCTVLSLILSNTGGDGWLHFWHTDLGGESVEYWINDGLMTIFFLLVGLELEREVYIGELSDIKDATLPIFGAWGGMLIPAAIFVAVNFGLPSQRGAGIPMATDIAFALAILSLLGKRVPTSLKVFLTALAVIDDLGAILLIAIFYSNDISLVNLGIALAIFGGLLALNRLKVRNLIPYLLGGVAMWWFMLHSGVHATITGVLLAFAIPFGNGDEKSTSYILQDFLHKPVAFLILPLFALANTAIPIHGSLSETLRQPYSIGIALGLVVGKPLGIGLFSYIACKLGICKLPGDISWKAIIGVGALGGIGFTMSIFITLLAFDDGETIGHAKLVILLSSLLAAILGFSMLRLILTKEVVETDG
ncbi:Na+/H+ antiporter NhaA [Flavobacterium sp. MAH-1]|uniref:Na(+)/H(+) antiporter NhaA n=1 Tax=Flavobacterium agri TaxID=2743471 RepID=A0A7Y8Y0Y3_9FLAO|nr:Na+/H+ antiporter NhaA [Flavobacterium agri]NUY80498.1 Na+/H+ antiporter NhaA [Flavobacterium agri]NYA70523.1 Na+/H+ antiporter NhaA [Flavobacterium agri]